MMNRKKKDEDYEYGDDDNDNYDAARENAELRAE